MYHFTDLSRDDDDDNNDNNEFEQVVNIASCYNESKKDIHSILFKTMAAVVYCLQQLYNPIAKWS